MSPIALCLKDNKYKINKLSKFTFGLKKFTLELKKLFILVVLR